MTSEEKTPEIHSYYQNLNLEGIEEHIRNFDDPRNLEFFSNAVSNARSRNFVIDFGDREAWCGFDLDVPEFRSLLRSPVAINTKTTEDLCLTMTFRDQIR